MNRQPFETPPTWWSPQPSPFWTWFWKPLRMRNQHRHQKLLHVDVRGSEHLQQAIDQGCGILLTPNHPGHADAFVMHTVADKVNRPMYFMAAWQVFEKASPLRKKILRHHGCFSVDREGTDLRAFRQAVDILQKEPYPLVIFPEGEVYHLNDRITPFRDGPAAIAMAAAKRADRPVVCLPCALTYHYVRDPMPELLQVMDRLEEAIFWRPRRGVPLPERIYAFASALLTLKETEYFGEKTGEGTLPERVARLTNHILCGLEARHQECAEGATVPERVKALRRCVIGKLANEADPAARQLLADDLDDLFLVVQLFSYPGDYVSEQPTIERLAETLDKFEEDVLKVSTATIRGARHATLQIGAPVPVPGKGEKREGAAKLMRTLEQEVQSMLAGLRGRSAAQTPSQAPQVA